MAGAVMNPVQVTGPVDITNGRSPSPSFNNDLRISVIVDKLLAFAGVRSTDDNSEICRLCVALSRCIDHAVGNNEIPDRALEMPYLLKQVCQWTNDTYIKTAIMVLTISIKGACRNGWFSEKDNEELHILSNEISSSFCSVRDMNSREGTTVHQSITTVFSRFYPRMKMGEILAFIEAMPGYGAFVKDFHITKDAKPPDESVHLFVAQPDNTETSSCLTSPQLVNFLVNGKAVSGRTCIYKDPGPQIPTPITELVKHGTNLLQAVGQFNGKYIIVVAFMSKISNPSCHVLPNYIPPVAAASDPDNDIVEGPSRISLNCPISFKRITTPVKGHLCKHLQCFDFDNYVDINSRRPSWRCPHCSQSVCFAEIRIDRDMAKVLKEVGANISHVRISADGSWEAVNECDDHADKQQDQSLHQEPTRPSDMSGVIMDLTEDNEVDKPHQEIEKKPSLAQLQDQPNPSDQIPSHVNMNHVHTNVSPHIDNLSFRRTHENGTSHVRPSVIISQGQTVISGSNNMQFATHATGTPNVAMNPMFQGQSQTQMSASTSSMQFQQHSMNSTSNGYSPRYTTPGRHMTRIPVAVQALPVQRPTGMVSGDRQQLSRFQMDQHQMMSMMTASRSENMGSQNWAHRDLSNVSSQPAQQFVAHPSPFHQSSGHQFNSYGQQSVNHTLPNLVQSPYVGPTTGQVSNQQNTNMPSFGATHHHAGPLTGSLSNQQPQVSGWTAPISASVQTSLSSMPVISSEEQRGLGQALSTQEASANATADQNWRPTGRMRGSLSGRAYSEAFSQSIFYPTQPIQATCPPVWNTPRPFIPPHLQALMANNVNSNGFIDGAGSSVYNGSGGAGVFPRK